MVVAKLIPLTTMYEFVVQGWWISQIAGLRDELNLNKITLQGEEESVQFECGLYCGFFFQDVLLRGQILNFEVD